MFEYLIGTPINIFEEKLPRKIDVVRYYFHFQNIEEKEKISNISQQMQRLYTRAAIPTIHFESIRSKVKRLIASVKNIIETRKSKSNSQIEKEISLLQKLTELFEVVQSESLLPESKKEFLADQRTMRRSFINFDLLDLQQPSTSTQIRNNSHHLLESAPSQNEFVPDVNSYGLETIDYDDTPDFDDWPDFDNSPDFVCAEEEKGKIKTKLLYDDIKELSKCGGSYRVIEKALSIGIKTAGGNPKNYAISKSSLCGQMNSFRTFTKSDILEQIASSEEKVIIHFDGKKMAKINEKHVGHDSRMVAVCHTQTKDVPLGLPILESGTAQSYANEIIGLCQNNNLIGRVVGLVCDTVVVNTGEHGGVCAIFEAETETEILYITCRHHIHEVLLSSAFFSALGTIEAPRIIIFEQLKAEWFNIKSSGYRYRPCDEVILDSFQLRFSFNEAKTILSEHAKSKFVRDDYAELNDLCLKFFGIETKKSFMVPGAISKSRWMAKAIYAIKTYLFRDQLALEEDFERDLLELSLFVSLIYCKYWNRCTNVFNAPVNDLSLMLELQQYSNYNENIANSVLNSFRNHLWYLGEELVVLALFSDLVSIEDKNIMRLQLQLTTREFSVRRNNSLRLKEYVNGMKLTDLTTERSIFLLSLLELDTSFLQQNAETWMRNKIYKKARKIVEDLIVVVNDPAERALGRASVLIQNQKARSEIRLQNMFLSLYS